MDKNIKLGLRWLLAYIDSVFPSLDARITEDKEEQSRLELKDREVRRLRIQVERAARDAAALTESGVGRSPRHQKPVSRSSSGKKPQRPRANGEVGFFSYSQSAVPGGVGVLQHWVGGDVEISTER